jgi:hypothetical protein
MVSWFKGTLEQIESVNSESEWQLCLDTSVNEISLIDDINGE